LTAGDGCDGSCAIEVSALCGNSNVDLTLFEQCDDGNSSSGDGCGPSCRLEPIASCGDGVLDLANDEQCDDNNLSSGDGCGPVCQFETVGATCGNGTLDGLEACDDGNLQAGDSCNPTCNLTASTSLFAGLPGQNGFSDGVGSAARLGGNGVLAVDSTTLYLGDSANDALRAIDIATGNVTTIAGGTNGYLDDAVGITAQFRSLEAITTDGSTIWVADSGNRVLRAVSLTPPHAVTTVAGTAGQRAHVDGIGAAARFDDLRGITYYGGFVYLLDGDASTLRRFDPATGEVVTLAGTAYSPGSADGLGPAARFQSPRYMASNNSGMLYVADTNGYALRAYNTVTTEVTTFAGTGTCGYVDGVGTAAAIHRPRGMTSDGTSVYFVEYDAHTIRQAELASAEVTTLLGTVPSCAVTCAGNCGAGGYAEGAGALAQLDSPFSIAYHYPSRSLFFVDGANFVIRRVQ
jgi:cysteine-rich repeat protein